MVVMTARTCPVCGVTFDRERWRAQTCCSTICRGAVGKRPIAERFWEKVDRRGPDECWPWLGVRSYGYGLLSPGRQDAPPLKAHRFSWTLHHGTIPDGLFVLHRCDNPPCVNPAHLFLGTNADNLADMWDKGRARPSGLSPRGRRSA